MNITSRRSLIALLVAFGVPVPAVAQDAQSPIDIRPEFTVYRNLAPLLFNYGNSVTLTTVNTGAPDEDATIRSDVAPGAGSLTLDGVVYELLQFHFHIHSEHCIHGVGAAMEMHQVHRSADGVLTVVGRLINEGAFNPALDPVFGALGLLANAGDTISISGFDLAAILPSDLRSFRYSGSLTTPGFAEGVNWVLLAEPLELSASQIAAFAALFPDGNAREKQEINGRIVRTDVEGFAVPSPASIALLGLGGAGLLAARRRRVAA